MLQSVVRNPQDRGRLLWAVRVRWLVIGGFLALASLAHPFGLFPRVGVWVWAALIGSVLNAFNHVAVRRQRRVVLITLVAVPMDHVLITYVVANTGGVHSPFLVMYSVQVVATALLVTFRAAVFSVLLGAVSFATAVVLESEGYVRMAPLYAPGLATDPVWAVRLGGLAWVVFLLYCLILLIFVGGYISERLYQSEVALVEKNRRLEESVISLEHARDELAAAYGRLKDAESQLVHAEKMRALGQLVAGVAHELSNPLSFVAANVAHLGLCWQRVTRLFAGATELISAPETRARWEALRREAQFDDMVADLPSLLRDCGDGTRRAMQIVRELRIFSRGAAGEQLGPVDVNKCLRGAVALLRYRFKERVAVHLDLPVLPDVLGIPGQLSQVFLNLLANADDAIEGQGQVWISSRAGAGDTAVIVRIRDTGCGIAPEHLGRVFEPFFTTKPVGEGTGLGLSISYAIVQRHGGSLAVFSHPGRGAQFEVTLPAADAPELACRSAGRVSPR